MDNDNFQQFATELNMTLSAVFMALDGKKLTDEIVDNITAELNVAADEVYKRYGVESRVKVTREFTLYLIDQLVNMGKIALSEPAEQEPKSDYPYQQERINLDDYVDADAHYNYDIPSQETPNYQAEYGGQAEYANKEDPELYSEGTEGFPENWAENLIGNFDAAHWASEFAVMAKLRPRWTTDEGYLIGWFANAIMAGHDHAMNLEHSPTELTPDQYWYLELYDIKDGEEVVEFTLTFKTYAAAATFIRLNSGKKTFKSPYYRTYQLEPQTTYIRRDTN